MNIHKVFLGKIANVLTPYLLRGKVIPQTIEGYTLIKDLTPIYTSRKNRIGLYQNASGEKVVIKRVQFIMETLDYLYMKNEAKTLKILSKLFDKVKLILV